VALAYSLLLMYQECASNFGSTAWESELTRAQDMQKTISCGSQVADLLYLLLGGALKQVGRIKIARWRNVAGKAIAKVGLAGRHHTWRRSTVDLGARREGSGGSDNVQHLGG